MMFIRFTLVQAFVFVSQMPQVVATPVRSLVLMDIQETILLSLEFYISRPLMRALSVTLVPPVLPWRSLSS